ncbi:two-component regulator propeller domain-containing protein [Pedobacter vanadiisoli]|uniref:histidine kinase n=1 Tax=Pedobacter vanadiisoli TaxID=1761975 RepID=A0ABW5MR47_9SPHI
MFRFLALICALVWCDLLYAQEDTFRFSRIDITNGLSDNQTNAIYKDHKGFMWFGTMAGLSRFDGHDFKIFRHNSKDSSSLPNGYVIGIFEGPEQELWVKSNQGFSIYDSASEKFENFQQKHFAKYKIPGGYLREVKTDGRGKLYFNIENQGIYGYDSKTGKSKKYFLKGELINELKNTQISDFIDDLKGNLWVVYYNGIIDKFNLKEQRVTNRYNTVYEYFAGQASWCSFSSDADGDIYIFSGTNPFGLFYLHAASGKFHYFGKKTDHTGLSSKNVSRVIEGDDGNIWIGTDHGGINILDKKTRKLTYILNKENDPRSLSDNSISSLYKDNNNIIWIGTFKKGICFYHKSVYKFPANPYLAGKSPIKKDVNCFAEDNNNNLWIGTNGEGLLRLNKITGAITTYRNNPDNNNSLSSDIVVSLEIDHEGVLWIGTYLGGLDAFDGKYFRHFKPGQGPAKLSDNRVYALLNDSYNRLWVGTLNGGLNLFDRQTGTFKHFNPDIKNTINSFVVSCLYEDKNKNIWIGTTGGVNIFDHKSATFKYLKNNPADSNSLIQNDVNSILQDARGWMWIGTKEGISIYDPVKGTFKNLNEAVGLPEDMVFELLEDEHHDIWYSSRKGLFKISISHNGKNYHFRYSKYNQLDGLESTQFNINAAGKTKAGELIFGGPSGFNIFRASEIKNSSVSAALVMTDLEVFYHKVRVGERINGHIVLPETITSLSNLNLTYKENIFSIQFALLNYLNPDKIIYKYNLEGFDKRWLTVSSELRKATFTNLDPGNYTLHVRAFNENDPLPIAESHLNITVSPPFWRTTWAYILYLALIGFALLYIRSRGILKLKREFALAQERAEARQLREQDRKEAERLRELDLLKIKFLTNLSHEFRTPISLILAPVDKLLISAKENERYGQLAMIKRNARRLLNLVNQLLDFRKMEEQELRLNNTEGEVVSFIKDATDSFYDLAERKQIKLTFASPIESLYAYFDQDKVERIVFNLLSNAFKFTPPGGKVEVMLHKRLNKTEDGKILLELKIQDSGIGIPADKQAQIFERFFQHETSASILNQGSGIGLSITKEFVKMQGGEITVESEPGQGTCFTLQLLLTPVVKEQQIHDSETEDLPAPYNTDDKEKAEKGPTDKPVSAKNAPVILLVEDNEDFRFYLKDNLSIYYKIIEASNGKEGWQKALALHPHLIVSDISMPEMSGTELCAKLKSDERTKHIPIILLTALTAEEEQLKGLETGANDYMTKPFNFEILHSKIKNLLTLHQTFKKTYSRQVSMSSPEMEIESDDVKFLNAALLYIEENLHNPQLSVEDLSSHMAMSRVSLYKKCLRVTGKTPVDFIRSVKLEKAAVLLEKSTKTISEICYMVGFSTPNYFAKAFKAKYNVLPSEYIAEKRNLN